MPAAQGRILEIGVGPGVNFPYYDWERVTKLYALEPNAEMVRRAERQRIHSRLDIEFIGLPSEQISLPDASIDSVVSTFTLCTIAGIDDALREVRRVLKDGGQLVFAEIGVAPDEAVRRWQRRWEPVHRRLFEGLHLTRDIPRLLDGAGFDIGAIESGYLTPFPKSWSHSYWGVAVTTSRSAA